MASHGRGCHGGGVGRRTLPSQQCSCLAFGRINRPKCGSIGRRLPPSADSDNRSIIYKHSWRCCIFSLSSFKRQKVNRLSFNAKYKRSAPLYYLVDKKLKPHCSAQASCAFAHTARIIIWPSVDTEGLLRFWAQMVLSRSSLPLLK